MTRLIVALAVLFLTSVSAAADSAYYTKDYQQQALTIYRDIIAIRSAEGHGKVPDVANYLADLFVGGGFDPADVHVLPQQLSTGEGTASLVVRYPGDGSSGEKPILLLAHMDVVDAIPSDWDRDPFTLVQENGYFFGRGTADNKLGVTALTTTFLRLKRENFVPNRDLVIAFTGDEESHMETTRALVSTHRSLTDAAYALNSDGGDGTLDTDGKPLYYQVQAAEKTYATYDLTVRNPGGHSSQPRKDNAIYELATALKNIEAYRFPARINSITRGYFETSAGQYDEPVRSAMRRFAKNPEDKAAADILEGMPSQVGLTRTTCIATMLKAGHAANALPQSATATVNCRIFPGETPEEVRDVLYRVAGNPELEVAMRADPYPEPSPVSDLDENVMAAVTKAIHGTYGEVPIIPSMSAYATDAKDVRIAGIPTFGVTGLFIRSEDEFSHGLNERVPVESFYKALEYWHLLLTDLAGR